MNRIKPLAPQLVAWKIVLVLGQAYFHVQVAIPKSVRTIAARRVEPNAVGGGDCNSISYCIKDALLRSYYELASSGQKGSQLGLFSPSLLLLAGFCAFGRRRRS